MEKWTHALWLLVAVPLVKSVPLELLFAYGESAGDTSLGGYDDHSSSAIKLSSPVHYYGRQYDAVYVNDNGLLSFLTELPNFHNVPFPLDYPLIAAFYSDVDVRGIGAVYYRLTTHSDLLDMFNKKISDSFSEGSSFQAEQLLIVTWSQVGYFDSNTDKRNTFQVVLGWSGENTFLMMLYADDGLQWIAGDGKIKHQPDARAQAGVISGDGRYTMLPFSGADQIQHLDKMSNCGQRGLFMFRVGVIEGTQDAAPPDIYFEEDGSGSGDTCATSGIMCHTYSTCDDYLDGFCCSCDSGYYGNGISCLTTEEPVRVMGRVSGELNGASIGEQSMQSYAVVNDGRCYTSLTKIPPSPGFDLQTLNAINDVVSWMFAKPGNQSVNGFQLTGGDASVTMYVEFPQTGDRMLISQQFQGVGVYNHINVHTNITGTAPPVYYGSTVHVEDYTNHIITLDTGHIQIRSQRLMRLGENSLFIPVHVTAEVVFSECAHRPRFPRHQHYKHAVGRNFIVYEKPEQIVRFASSNQISLAKGSDACEVATEKCGQFSVCVATDDGGFQCLCSPGYRRSSSGSGIATLSACEDIDECDEGLHCDSNAICSNTPGSYTCSCSAGFTGDGRSCRAVLSCSELNCGENGRCYEPKPGTPQCECDDGFIQDELICFPQKKTVCSSRSDCGPNSDCLYVVWASGYICQCDVGYTGDGVRCLADTPPVASCNGVRCHPHADCVTDASAAVCVCNLGLIGDGYTVCQQPPTESHCETSVDCGTNAECGLADWLGRKVCMCNAGYVGDGVNCSLATSAVELCNGKRCDWNALCTLVNGVQQCTCRPGYHGNGIQCQQSSHSTACFNDSSCGLHAGCVYAPWTGGNTCLCDVGYVRQGEQCVLPNSADSQLCSKDTDCGVGGRCQYDGSRPRFICQPGQIDAELPTQKADDCYSSFNCSAQAVCVYDSNADGFECRCQPGYYGDGYTCTSTTDATSQPTQPTVLEASCVFDFCVCREGYRLTTDKKHCIKIYGTPSPVCFNSVCACPDMFVYLRTTNSCLPATSSRPEENGVVLHTTPGNPSSSRPKPVSCLADMECGANAICDYSAIVDGYVCSCLPGFSLDDSGCVSPADSDCRAMNDCHSDALCVFNNEVGRHVCQCQQGFEGDGKHCDQITLGCKLLNNCGLRASCVYEPRRIRYVCQCDQGYVGDGYTCRSQVTCYNDPTMCDRYATCVSRQDGFHCVCRTNYVGNGTSCRPERRHAGGFLLLTQGAAVVKVPFAASVRGRPLVFQPSQTAVGIDTDCISGRFYWTDVAGRKIKSAMQNGSDWLEFASGDIGSPEGVAVDFVSRNVYWTDSTRHRIEVASIITGHRFTLISVGLANVRGVAVHPGRGAIYWADWNRQQPRIEAASLDGSRRRLLLGQQLQLPNSLAVDFDTDQLCWTDAGAKTIECLSLNSRQRRLLVPAASYPFGIAITDTHIYWTDWNDKRIHALEKASGERGKSLKSVLGASSKPYGLAVTARSCPLGVTNVCARENGGCASDQLCLPNERYDRTCVCPNTRASNAGPLSPQCQ